MPLDFSSFAIEVDLGETANMDFAISVGGVAQNITGWLIWFTAKRRVADPDAAAVIQHSTAAGGVTITNAVGGLGTVTLSPADTAGLPEQRLKLFADLQGKDGGGNLWTLSKGQIIIRPKVTDSSS
jgi:hypothetical protein